jgi:hypothetical protein
MAKKRFSGLDELMIVNPGPGPELGQVFFGEDGTLYRLEGLQEAESPREFAEFYLGEDGTLYQLQSFGPFPEPPLREQVRNLPGRYFLGEDGTLFQAIR